MTKFLDGPAAGKTLMLKNSPTLLRVTQRRFQLGSDKSDEFDALDRHTDEPKAEESMHVYALKEHKGNCHIRMGGKAKSASGFYTVADYVLHSVQPEDAVMRDKKLWLEWYNTQVPN